MQMVLRSNAHGNQWFSACIECDGTWKRLYRTDLMDDVGIALQFYKKEGETEQEFVDRARSQVLKIIRFGARYGHDNSGVVDSIGVVATWSDG